MNNFGITRKNNQEMHFYLQYISGHIKVKEGVLLVNLNILYSSQTDSGRLLQILYSN